MLARLERPQVVPARCPRGVADTLAAVPREGRAIILKATSQEVVYENATS
jgi:hypothetical protein